MRSHRFTLILRCPGAVTEELEDSVFEAGCDDASLGFRSGSVFLEFDREAPSLLDAVLSAIDNLSALPEVSISHVEPDELVNASEIARRTGRTRESVRLLIEGVRGPGGFPTPLSGSRGGRMRVWRWSEVLEWLGGRGVSSSALPEARVIAAVNGALALARNADRESQRRILKALRRAS